MNNKITSKIIGQLLQNDKFSDWWMGANTAIPFFADKKLPVIFKDYLPAADPKFIEDADKALKIS